MDTSRTIFAVDSHTVGEPTRVVIGGVDPIPGKTMADKKAYAARHLDEIRASLMHEPRGHKDMFGSIIQETTHEQADLGLIFMDGGGYLDMCGHGSIGAVTVALEMGILKMEEPETRVTLETPAGLVPATAKVKNGKVTSVTIQNVPSYLLEAGVPLELPDYEPIRIDIAYGGNFFALVDIAPLDLEITPANTGSITSLGLKILETLKHSTEFLHPVTRQAVEVNLVEFYGPAVNREASARNVVVFGEGQVDRSPCGTGTCAKMATLFSQGKLKLGERYVHESIIGSVFEGRLLSQTQVGAKTAVVPEITATAFITGLQQFIFDASDPLRNGFTLG